MPLNIPDDFPSAVRWYGNHFLDLFLCILDNNFYENIGKGCYAPQMRQGLDQYPHRNEYTVKHKKGDFEYRNSDFQISGFVISSRKNIQPRATGGWQHYDTFKQKFAEYIKILFTEIDKCSLDENYMPLIDDNKTTNVSSASLKVAIRIAYILALLTSNSGEDGSHVGFLLLDSPKDKDLDDYRFEKYLGIINGDCKGQILITGSVSDRDIYKKELVNAKFFEELTTEHKLLR